MHKPDSVFWFASELLSFIWFRFRNRNQAANPFCIPTCAGNKSEQLLNRIYLAFQPARFTRDRFCNQSPWSLTSHFHPYQTVTSGSYFLWHLLSSINSSIEFHPLGGAALCVVRTFLSDKIGSTIFPAAVISKINKSCTMPVAMVVLVSIRQEWIIWIENITNFVFQFSFSVTVYHHQSFALVLNGAL